MNSNFVKIISVIIIILLTVLIAFSIRDVEREVKSGGSEILLTKTSTSGEAYEKKVLDDKEKEKLFNKLVESNILVGIISVKDYTNSIFSDVEMLNLLPIIEEESFEKTEDGNYKVGTDLISFLSKKYFNRDINLSKTETEPEEGIVTIYKTELKEKSFTYETIQNISSSDYELLFHDENEQKYSLCFSLRDNEIVYISFEKI